MSGQTKNLHRLLTWLRICHPKKNQVIKALEELLENIALQEADENQRKRQRVGEASSSSGHQTPSSTVGKVLLNTKQLAVKKVEPYVFANEQSVNYDCGDIIAHSRNRCEVIVDVQPTPTPRQSSTTWKGKMAFKA